MAYIWLLILAGIIVIPVISGAAKELERRLEKEEGEAQSLTKKAVQKKEDMKFTVKLLTYTVIIIFIIIVIIMAKFIGEIIYSN